MIRVEILQATAAEHPDGWAPIGTITADGLALTTDGDRDKLVQILALTVPDPATRTGVITAHDQPEAWAATRTGVITAYDQPEAWAATLPDVLRGPALIARVTAA